MRNDQVTAFVKQGRDESWLRYENGLVAPVSSIREVTQDNFGGSRRSKTAMHLTYIREDSIDEFFAERDSTSLPPLLSDASAKCHIVRVVVYTTHITSYPQGADVSIAD